MPVPEDAPEPPDRHYTLGAYSHRWTYHAADGALAGYVCRFETATDKEMRPLRYGRLRGRVGWHWKGWPGDDVRPLYGLPELTANPDSLVLVVEGEKAADAAAAALPGYVVAVSPMNGAQSPHKTDWSPLAGRNVVIWPDNDEPGQGFARVVAMLALKAGAGSVSIVDVPDTLPECWDLADPVPEGIEIDHASMIADAPAFDPDGEEQGTFRVQWRQSGEIEPGVHYRVSKEDPETGEKILGWHWFASRVDVLAYSRDSEGGEWARYLAIHDNDRAIHHFAMPMM